jgi:gliding motility-associated-like protein
MRKILFFIVLLYSTPTTAQTPWRNTVIARVIDTKFQFVNIQTGLPVDSRLWDEADPFVNGFSRVFLKDKFSFVNNEGKLINPIELDNARDFSNKMAAVQKNRKWGFINESGKIVFPFKYDIVFDFEDAVSVAYENKKWWLISNKGDVIKLLDISVCFGFKNGAAKVIKDDYEGVLYSNGSIILNKSKKNNSTSIPYHPNSNVINSVCPPNINFENGNFSNWLCYIGRVDSVGNTNVTTMIPATPVAPVNNRHTIVPKATPSLLDFYGLFPTNPPDGSNFAVKLGNTSVGAEAERIRYTIRVPVNDTNFSIKYDYAVVFENPGHTLWTQPRFNAKILDSATNTYITCASFEYIATSGLPGFQVSTVSSSVLFKPWSSVFVSMRGYAGRTLYLEFTTTDCVRKGHWGYAYVDVQSVCGQAIEMQYNCTFPNITTLTGPPGFQTYNWWNQNFTTLIGTGQTITLNPGPVVNTVMWLEMIPFLNFGCKDTLKVIIAGTLNPQIAVSDTIVCGVPHTFTFYNRTLPSTSTIWDFGDGFFGTGDTVTHTYTLPGSYLVILNVTVPSGCNGTDSILVQLKPIPTVVQPANQTLCNGATTNAIAFAGAVSGTTYSWSNNNNTIGLPGSGTGNIASFTAINTTNAPVTATITVTPTAAGCAGLPQTFTITVNPTPTVVQPANQVLCNGATTNTITFAGAVSGTTYSWINSNTSIGLGANGNGNIPSFTAVNAGTTSVTATITVTPTAAGCAGTAQSFYFVVQPRPAVNLGPDLNLSTGTILNLNTIIQNGPIINWAWVPITGLSCTNCPSPSLKVANNISYKVTVTNIYSCIASDDIYINTYCKSGQVFIPNAFTPNGDGLNDILMVRGKGIFVKTFRIFNRWGELVFEKTNFNPNDIKYGWDGKIRGIPATPDVFVYTAEVICDNNVVYTYKGNTTLLK